MLKTGEVVYGPQRLPNDFYSASPVLADGKIYVTGETTGVTTVFRAGPQLRDPRAATRSATTAPRICLSSVAVSEGQLFIRSSAHLWVVGQRRK